MRCDHALRDALSSEGDAASPALAHMLACGNCMARLDQLARAAISQHAIEIACAECRDRLPDFRYAMSAPIDAADAGAPRLVETLVHLRRCPDCSVELAALTESMDAWEAGRFPALEGTPVFDLSFLEAEAPLWREVLDERSGDGTTLRQLVTELVLRLEAGSARFGLMPGPLSPQAAGAALRDTGLPAAEVLSLADTESDLNLRVTVGPAAGQTAALALSLRQRRSDRPLSDTRVLLYDAASQLLASAMTAEDGAAKFRDLRPGRYLIEIRRPEGRWRLPLRVDPEAAGPEANGPDAAKSEAAGTSADESDASGSSR